MAGSSRGDESEGRGLFEGAYTGRPDPRGGRWLALALVGAAIALGALFVGGEYLQRLVRYREARVGVARAPEVALIEPVRNIVLNTLPEVAFLANTDQLTRDGLPIFDIRIDAKDWQGLQATARHVMARFYSTDVPREYVPAELLRDGKWAPIQVKLRGYTSDHYLLRRPSLRLKFPRDRLMEGKRQINLVDLYDKGLTQDATTNWELRQRGLLTWDSRFAVVRLNGEVLGLYQEIEHFGRGLLDRNGRPEGFILSGDGEILGSEGQGYDKAMAAFEKFKACGQIPIGHGCNWNYVSAHFDLERWSWAGAMLELLQSSHGWHPGNLRMFWDPALGRFEPIPWDYGLYEVDPVARAGGECCSHGYGFGLASIPEFRRLRDQRLWVLVTERIEPMIAESQRMFEALREPLSHDLRHVGMSLDESRQARYGRWLRGNATLLKSLFEHHQVRARWWGPDEFGFATLTLSNHGKSALSLRAVEVVREGERDQLVLPDAVALEGSWWSTPGRTQVRFALAPGTRVASLVMRDEVTGVALSGRDIELSPGSGAPPPPAEPSESAGAVRPAPELAIEGIRVEGANVILGPGRVRLDTSLEIADSRDVVFAAGLDLWLADGVSLILHGDLSSVGTAERPIRVSGAPGWGGVFAHGSRTRPSHVRMEHTTFDGGMGGENSRVTFTAPFSLHAGTITLRSSHFLNSRAIDGVNFKYAEVDIRGMTIRGAADDAFDCDFCTGRVVGSVILDVGGDGLDFSGSDLLVQDSEVARCGDKGVSIGERSRLKLERIRVSDCYTGIAVKDQSDAEISDAYLARLEVGISLYVKKPTFGPSHARVERVELDAVSTSLLRDESCSLDWVGRSQL